MRGRNEEKECKEVQYTEDRKGTNSPFVSTKETTKNRFTSTSSMSAQNRSQGGWGAKAWGEKNHR